jgi:hypothetical protein
MFLFLSWLKKRGGCLCPPQVYIYPILLGYV